MPVFLQFYCKASLRHHNIKESSDGILSQAYNSAAAATRFAAGTVIILLSAVTNDHFANCF